MPFAWGCGVCLGGTEVGIRWGKALPWGHAFVPGPPWGWVLAYYATLGLATLDRSSRWRSRRVWWPSAIAIGAILAILPTV